MPPSQRPKTRCKGTRELLIRVVVATLTRVVLQRLQLAVRQLPARVGAAAEEARAAFLRQAHAPARSACCCFLGLSAGRGAARANEAQTGSHLQALVYPFVQLCLGVIQVRGRAMWHLC